MPLSNQRKVQRSALIARLTGDETPEALSAIAYATALAKAKDAEARAKAPDDREAPGRDEED